MIVHRASKKAHRLMRLPANDTVSHQKQRATGACNHLDCPLDLGVERLWYDGCLNAEGHTLDWSRKGSPSHEDGITTRGRIDPISPMILSRLTSGRRQRLGSPRSETGALHCRAAFPPPQREG